MHGELEEIVDFLKTVRPFDELAADQLKGISKKLFIKYFKRQQAILELSQQIDSLYIIRTGAVDMLDSDNELITRVYEKGSFGFVSMINQQSSFSDVVAHEDCLIYILPGEIFKAICDSHNDFKEYFELASAQRLNKAINQLKSHQFNFNSHLASPVSKIIKRDAVSSLESLSISGAAQLMAKENVSCLMIVDDSGDLSGLITDKDLRKRVVAKNVDTSAPVSSVMSKKLTLIDAQTMAFEAGLLMMRHNIHHLPIVTDSKPVGLISTTDLLKLSNQSPVYTISEIAKSTTIGQLAQISGNIPAILSQLVHSGLPAYQVGQVVSTIGENINIRLLELAQENLGPAPVDYCWLAAGSLGRREQLLHSDQDNALLLSDKFDASAHSQYFESLSRFVSDGLNECGYVYCPGDVMATNPKWCRTLTQWKDYFTKWINEPEPMALMYCSIFFDMRALYGKRKLFKKLKKHYLGLAKGNGLFLNHLSVNALQNSPPLGFFRQLVLVNDKEHKNRLNLKNRGTAPIVDLARVYALSAGLKSLNTHTRLVEAKSAGEISETVADNLLDAYEFINSFRMKHQAEQIISRVKPDNFANPDNLSEFERDHLHDAFKIVADSQKYLVQRYTAGHIR